MDMVLGFSGLAGSVFRPDRLLCRKFCYFLDKHRKIRISRGGNYLLFPQCSNTYTINCQKLLIYRTKSSFKLSKNETSNQGHLILSTGLEADVAILGFMLRVRIRVSIRVKIKVRVSSCILPYCRSAVRI